jgi:hypothetical protein
MPDDTDQPDDNLPSGTILPPADRHSIKPLTRRTPAADLTTLIPPGLAGRNATAAATPSTTVPANAMKMDDCFPCKTRGSWDS